MRKWATARQRLLELVHERTNGQSQVRARVAVGNRVDIQAVDPWARALERFERRPRQPKQYSKLGRRRDPVSLWL